VAGARRRHRPDEFHAHVVARDERRHLEALARSAGAEKAPPRRVAYHEPGYRRSERLVNLKLRRTVTLSPAAARAAGTPAASRRSARLEQKSGAADGHASVAETVARRRGRRSEFGRGEWGARRLCAASVAIIAASRAVMLASIVDHAIGRAQRLRGALIEPQATGR